MRKRKTVLAIRLLLLVTAVVIMTVGMADATPTATRTLPAELVPADRSFSVEIEVSDYGTIVVETLPDGFTYTTSTLNSRDVKACGQTTFEFTLYKKKRFTYYVDLKHHDIDTGTHDFRGIFKDRYKEEYEIGGDTKIVVTEPEEDDDDAEPTARRTLPEEPVAAGESFSIEIEASYYGIQGFVVETLPDGFEFEDYSRLVEVEGDTVEFELWGEPSFTYTVTAPDEEDTYTFEGILINEDKNEYDIGGDTEIVVGEEAGEIILPVNITAWKPTEAVVNNIESESRTFNISINQPADIRWQINGTEVQTNESVTDTVYTNTSSVIGTWNVSAIATNTTTGLSDIHTWIWRVTSTSAANMTSTPTPTSAVAPTPLLTPTPKSRLSPRPTSSATPTPAKSAKPAIPGFEPVFALAAIFAVAYLLLFRKKEMKEDECV